MAKGEANTAEPELRRVYRFSGLLRSGWTFRRAIENNSVCIVLRATDRALRSKELRCDCKTDESVSTVQHGKLVPVQRAFFQEAI